MRANRVISRGELIDAVWGADAPPSAEGGVYTYVAGLRRIFEPGRSLRGPGRILVSTGAGYVLHLIPGQPDAVSFEQHLGRARLLRKNGDLPGAVAALDEALGLWRGVQAFAGVPGPFAETERTRLGELRSAANEERADALLALNRHEEVLADLTAMVADYPLRERMRGLLMIALYRSGRQAEALKVFAEGRRVLAEELGIDPGAELARIHQQVLVSDPALAPAPLAAQADLVSPADSVPAGTVPAGTVPAGAVPTGTVPAGATAGGAVADDSPPVPAQLPSDAPGFSGRQAELSIMHGMLTRRGSVPIVAISGTAGVGKTALAVRFGRQVARRFPDGQLYLNLRGFDPALDAVMPSDALRFILVALGVPPSRVPPDLEGRAALYRSMADGKRLLIVLDNAAGASQVRPLLPGSPSCLVVVTSRNEVNGLVAADGAVPINLDVLDQDEAREMLDLRLGADRIGGDPRSADEIIAACARLPLALSIAVGRAAGRPKRPLAELAAELRQAMSGLDALEDDDIATDVRAVFSWSYDQLSAKAARMFRLLGLHPGPDISLSAAASLAGVPRQDAAAALRELVRTSMVTERTHARYGFHDLLRAYAADRAKVVDSERDRREAAQRMLDHYMHGAMAASHRFNPTTKPLPLKPPLPGVALVDVADKNQAVSWFDAEFPTLLAVIGYAAANGFDEYAWQLPYTLLAYCLRRGRWQEEENIQQIALAAARRLGDPRALAYAHLQLGHAQVQLMNYEAAEPNFRESLARFRDLGDRSGEAMALGGLGTMFDNQRQHAAALSEFLVMLRIVKALGHWWTQGSVENCVGWQYAMLGRYSDGLEHCQRALALLRESGNAGVMADTLDSLGMIYYRLGDHVASKDYYARAIDLHRELGAAFGEAQSRQALGDVFADEGDEPAARKAYEEALATLGALRHPLAEEVRAKLVALDTRAPQLLHT